MNKDVLVQIVKPILDKFLGGTSEASIPKFSVMGGMGNIVAVAQALNTAREHLANGTLAESLVNQLPEDVLTDIENAILALGYSKDEPQP